MPNKNIDYPGLALPSLTASLRQRGISVQQIDMNMLLRNEIITPAALNAIVDDSIPAYATTLSTSAADIKRLWRIQAYLRHLRDSAGFESICDVKVRAQARDYDWIFASPNRFETFLALFKINRALHYLLDAAVAASYVGHTDFLTQKITECCQRIISAAKSLPMTVVGFSMLDIQRRCTARAIELLRPVFDGPIIVGGADPTRFPREYMDLFPEIDAVFCREADESLPLYLERLDDPRYLREVPGIYYRDAHGVVIGTQERPVNLSSIPCPDFDGLPLGLYLTPALPIQASRGCYWHRCRFCIHWKTYSDFRVRSPNLVAKDLAVLRKKHYARYFHFVDDCLPVPYARRLAAAIKTAGLDVRWLVYFRLEHTLTFDVLSEVYDAGARILEMGLESASESVLRLMQKNIAVADADRIVRDAARIGIVVKLFMFHGYPGENLSDLEKTISFTEDRIVRRAIRPFIPLRNRFELLQGSDIYDSVCKGEEEVVSRWWLPSGKFAIRAEYELHQSEEGTRQLIAGFVTRVRKLMEERNLYHTDDESIMVDLLVLDLSPADSGPRCI